MAKKKTLREWREDRGLTPLEVAAKAKVSLTTVQDVEANHRSPTVVTALKIAAALGVSVADVAWPDESQIVRRPRRPKGQPVAA